MSPARRSSESAAHVVRVNRAPVLALWAAVVAERAGFRREEALTLGQALAGLNARSKGKRLGIYEDTGKPEKRLPVHDGSAASARAKKIGAKFAVALVGREVPAIRTEDGVRAIVSGKPTNPESVAHYLAGKLGDDLGRVRKAMEKLADAHWPEARGAHGYALYEAFRPKIPTGTKGWGAKGVLDLAKMKELAKGE